MDRVTALTKPIDILERRMAEVLDRIGITGEAFEAYERNEALDHMTRTGDPTLIKEYQKKKNAKHSPKRS